MKKISIIIFIAIFFQSVQVSYAFPDKTLEEFLKTENLDVYELYQKDIDQRNLRFKKCISGDKKDCHSIINPKFFYNTEARSLLYRLSASYNIIYDNYSFFATFYIECMNELSIGVRQKRMRIYFSDLNYLNEIYDYKKADKTDYRLKSPFVIWHDNKLITMEGTYLSFDGIPSIGFRDGQIGDVLEMLYDNSGKDVSITFLGSGLNGSMRPYVSDEQVSIYNKLCPVNAQ